MSRYFKIVSIVLFVDFVIGLVALIIYFSRAIALSPDPLLIFYFIFILITFLFFGPATALLFWQVHKLMNTADGLDSIAAKNTKNSRDISAIQKYLFMKEVKNAEKESEEAQEEPKKVLEEAKENIEEVENSASNDKNVKFYKITILDVDKDTKHIENGGLYMGMKVTILYDFEQDGVIYKTKGLAGKVRGFNSDSASIEYTLYGKTTVKVFPYFALGEIV